MPMESVTSLCEARVQLMFAKKRWFEETSGRKRHPFNKQLLQLGACSPMMGGWCSISTLAWWH